MLLHYILASVVGAVLPVLGGLVFRAASPAPKPAAPPTDPLAWLPFGRPNHPILNDGLAAVNALLHQTTQQQQLSALGQLLAPYFAGTASPAAPAAK